LLAWHPRGPTFLTVVYNQDDREKMRLAVLVLEVVLGLLYANMCEWVFHKYAFHVLGRKKKSIFAFHWWRHHQLSRRHGFVDEDYLKPWGSGKELWSLLAAGLLHSPLFFIYPVFTLTLFYGIFNYYYVHRKSHIDTEWAKKHLRWHYEHHMGKNQNVNYCVTKPWFDWVMGTRVKYDYLFEKNEK